MPLAGVVMSKVPLPRVNCSVLMRWFWSNPWVTAPRRIIVTLPISPACGLCIVKRWP